MGTIRVRDGTEICFNDWDEGQPVVLSHAWSLSADAAEGQMLSLAGHGFRCMAHDRRDGAQFWEDLRLPFCGYGRPGAVASESVREVFWRRGLMAGFPALDFCIEALSDMDLTQDLARCNVPTPVLHGSADQIVPIDASARRSAARIKDAALRVYDGAPTDCAPP